MAVEISTVVTAKEIRLTDHGIQLHDHFSMGFLSKDRQVSQAAYP